MKIIDRCTIHGKATIQDALAALNASGEGIALVVDAANRLVGVLTDGDVRRALMRGAGLNDSIESALQKQFVSVPPQQARADVLDLMQARRLRHVPIVDETGRLVGLHLLREIVGHNEKPNWAVIMAGGRGSRLGKLTEETPKPMLKVAGRPILERIVLQLVNHGIRRVFLSVNYLGHMIEDYFGGGDRLGCKIEYLREAAPLGTGGALSLLAEAPTAPVLVMNGDLVTQTNFSQMLEFHDRGSFYATMGLRPYAHEIAFGCAAVDGDRLVGIEEKPVLQKTVNAGVYVLSPAAIQAVPAQTFYPITSLFEDALRQKRACGAYLIEEEWLDVGHPTQLHRANGLL